MTILFLKVGRLGVKNHFPDKKKKKKKKKKKFSEQKKKKKTQNTSAVIRVSNAQYARM